MAMMDYTSPAAQPPAYLSKTAKIPTTTPGETNRFRSLQQAATPKPDYLRVIAEQTAAAQPKPSALRTTGATPGEANRFAALAAPPVSVTSAGRVVAPPPGPDYLRVIAEQMAAGSAANGGAAGDTTGDTTGDTSDDTTAGTTGGTTAGTTAGTTTGDTTGETTDSGVDVQALYDSLINNLLEGTFIGFQGNQASELRRLQNLRNQLYGDPEYGTTGSLQRQRDLDARARRRLAAQRAVAGMLQGGAYAGPQRGLGTIQQEQQEYDIQEMLRPYREQTQADRLREFGLGYTPDSRVFDLLDFGNAEDIMSGWATGTFAGRQAAAEARRAALEQLAQRGLSL